MEPIWIAVITILVVSFIVRVIVFARHERKARARLAYIEQLMLRPTIEAVGRGWDAYERDPHRVDPVSGAAEHAELLEHHARLIAIPSQDDDDQLLARIRGMLVETVSSTLLMLETSDREERAHHYGQSRTKLNDLVSNLGPPQSSGAFRFRDTNLGAFLFGDPHKWPPSKIS